MPAVARVGDICTGHECFPPRACAAGSPNVYVNSRAAHRVGDAWNIHTCTDPGTPHGSHDSVLGSGSGSVYVNGKALGRIGDSVACGSSVATGSGDVFAGG